MGRHDAYPPAAQPMPMPSLYCQWCRERFRILNGIAFCIHCDQTHDMTRLIPGREYKEPKGQA